MFPRTLSKRIFLKYIIIGALSLGLIDGFWNLLIQTRITLFSVIVEWILFFLLFGTLARIPSKTKLVLIGGMIAFPALLFSLVVAIAIAFTTAVFSRWLSFYSLLLGGYFVYAFIQGVVFEILSGKRQRLKTSFAILNGIGFILGITILGLNENNLFYSFWTSNVSSYTGANGFIDIGNIIYGHIPQFALIGLIRGGILGGFIGLLNNSSIDKPEVVEI